MKTAYVSVDNRFFALGRYYATFDEMERETDAIVARREKLAGGRTLSERELQKGIDRGPLPVRERLEHNNWRPVTDDAPPIETNPFRRDLQELEAQRKYANESTRERLTRLAAEKWDADKAAEQTEAERKAAFAADPKRQRALTLAADQLEWAQYSPEATASDIAHCERTLTQLQQGLLDPGIQLLEQGRQRIEAIATERAAILNAELQRVRETYKAEPMEQEPKREYVPREGGHLDQMIGQRTAANMREGARELREKQQRSAADLAFIRGEQ